MSENQSKLERGLSLAQATSINMIDMVGIGPFITIPAIVAAMKGPQCVLAWLLGAVLAFMDGSVWAELGAKWPMAGGSYVFLQRVYGEGKFGKMMSFLLVWQTIVQAPLVIASAAIGFSQYLNYLVTLTDHQQKAVSGGLVILVVILLYRNIKSIGKISVLMWIITGGTFLWLIGSGFIHFNPHWAFDFSGGTGGFSLSGIFWVGLGQASLQSVYSYLGYYNVCHLGGEIIKPEKNIPKSIFISVGGIALIYILMQIVVSGSMPWQQIANTKFIVSIYFEHIYGPLAGKIGTLLVLLIAASSLFAVVLGYSRIPYAAAVEGDFFKAFAKTHPRKHFPYVSLLVLGGLGFAFSLLFKLTDVIKAILAMRILVQFVGQSVGVIYWHATKPNDERPYKMRFYPLPAIIGIIIWLFIFAVSPPKYIIGAIGYIFLGILVYWLIMEPAKRKRILQVDQPTQP